MAQTVEYTLKLNIDGQDHVVNLSSDVKQLAEDLEKRVRRVEQRVSGEHDDTSNKKDSVRG